MLCSRSLNSFTHEPPVLARLGSYTGVAGCQALRVHKARYLDTCVLRRRLRALARRTPVTYIHICSDIAQLIESTRRPIPCSDTP